jgi:hypothetical protein
MARTFQSDQPTLVYSDHAHSTFVVVQDPLDPVTLCLESRPATFLGTIMLKGAAENGKRKKR